MPSRRRTSRALPPMRTFSRTKSLPRLKIKSKNSQKPRLVRRYVRRKQDDAKAHPKHPASPNLRVSGQEKPKIPNPALKSPRPDSHNAVAADSKSASHRPIIEEVTTVPNPTPDTGINLTTSVGAGFPLLGAISDTSTLGLILPSTTSLALSLSPTPPISFSALPPLPSLVASETAAITGNSRIFGSSSAFLPKETNGSTQFGGAQSHQINIAVVVLLTVGSALLLLGACITIKMCTRPRRHPRPTPSLPILKDTEPDEDFFETQDSPIFGGKERMSPLPGSTGPTWTWVQYPNPKPTQPAVQIVALPQPDNPATRFAPESQAPSVAQITDQLPDNIPSQTPLQNLPSAILHAHKRRSIASVSTYSPVTHGNIGQAFCQNRQQTAFTADGHDVIKRSKSKASPRRRSQPGLDDRRHRDSAASCVGLAYDGEDIASPGPIDYLHTQETPILNNGFEGRARIKSGYFAAGTYPRISTLPSATYSIATATRINVGHRNSFAKDKFALQKSNSKRQRDTQALTYALGLASPKTEYIVSSPQPTLYPDDSMSVVDARRPKKRNPNERTAGEAVPDVPVIVPTEKGSGTLMAMEFGVSQMSLSGLALEPVSDDGRESTEGHDTQSNATSITSRNMDKPPRVPSPPPLPSLTQMGLAHNNPEAYASYRSPTYSLYGLYEVPDRKSLVR